MTDDSAVKQNLRLNWLIAVLLAGWLLYLLAPVLTPFVAAALLAYLGDPLADRLQRLRIPRGLAVLTVFLLTFACVGLLVLLVVPLFRAQISALLDALPGIITQVEQVCPHRALRHRDELVDEARVELLDDLVDLGGA